MDLVLEPVSIAVELDTFVTRDSRYFPVALRYGFVFKRDFFDMFQLYTKKAAKAQGNWCAGEVGLLFSDLGKKELI